MTARSAPSRTLFDTIAVIDWSARSTPSPFRESADAIWIGLARQGSAGVTLDAPLYVRTRSEAEAVLLALARAERAEGRRVLMGFDFPFGFPAGTADLVTGQPAGLALWDWLADAVQDMPTNANNRFEVASRVNRLQPGPGPFWGRPAAWPFPGVPTRKKGLRFDHPAERRIVERRLPGAKSVWQLMYAGSVGSQALLGLPVLRRLLAATGPDGGTVWPLRTGFSPPQAPLVLAEVYPSLLAGRVRAEADPAEVRDRAQVRIMARRLAELDAGGRLAELFEGPDDLSAPERQVAEREEAWILGAGHEACLRDAA